MKADEVVDEILSPGRVVSLRSAILSALTLAQQEARAEWVPAARSAMELLMMFPADAMGFRRAGEIASQLRALLEGK